VIVHHDDTGYIEGQSEKEGWWISAFVIFPHNRGQGLARALATHLPEHCSLLAMPMGMGPHIPLDALIRFYESLGFTRHTDVYGNSTLMRR
jgi:GNAT superfamily N-acetyltransferase